MKKVENIENGNFQELIHKLDYEATYRNKMITSDSLFIESKKIIKN